MIRLLSITLISCLFSVHVAADIYSASSALSRGDYATAAAEFKKLAEAGDERAQANLGYMYYAGEGVPQDYQQAVYWYRKAAVQGNKDAQYNLAVSYAFGEGVKQDLTEAAIWYRRAGEQGHIVSQYSLGISYAYGEGVPQDQKEAARWFKKAADQGYARAQVHLGSMYHTGEGVEQNYTEAARWYRMAADRGDATAQYNLGVMYRSGRGLEQNYAQAKRWFRQSADQGYAAAQNELASLERSAAANVATRSIQAKPELFASEETVQTSKQEVDEATAAIKEEPVQKEIVATQDIPDEVSTPATLVEEADKTNDIQGIANKPLFSVEKKDLLTLDESQLDIAEPTPEKKELEEKPVPQVTKIEEEAIQTEVEVEVEESELAEVEEPTSESSSTIHNALGLPTPTDNSIIDEEQESSGGFFSKLFAKKETPEPGTGLTEIENEIADTEPVKEDITEETITEAKEIIQIEEPSSKPVPVEPFIETPRVYPQDVRAAELAALKEQETIEAEYSAIDSPSEISDITVEEDQSSGGFFSALGDFFTAKETEPASLSDNEEIEDEIAGTKSVKQDITEETTITEAKEIVQIEEPSSKPEPVEPFIETPRVYPQDVKAAELAAIAEEEVTELDKPINQPSAINNALGIPEPNADDENTSSSGGFFSRLFSSNDTSESDTVVSDAEDNIDEGLTTEIIDKEVTTPTEEVFTQEEQVSEEVEEQIATPENSWAETSTDESELEVESIEDTEESAGFFSALGNFFSGSDKEPELTATEPETNTEEVLIAKLEEPASIIEEPGLTEEAETDLSQFSISSGRTALANNDYDEAVRQFEPLAKSGSSEAQAHLGSLYYVGKGVKQDFAVAYNWYKKSADQGNMDAQYSIGNMYLLGEGVEQNNTDAEKWYVLAGEQGHVAAKNNLNSLKKLEALNQQNQLEQETLANKQPEETVTDVVENTKEVAFFDEAATDTTPESTEESNKTGLLGLFGGLFGSDADKASIQDSEVDSNEPNVISDTDLIEAEMAEEQTTNVKSYAAGEAPATNSLQELSDEPLAIEAGIPDTELEVKETTQPNDISLTEGELAAPSSEQPSFFKRLFASDDLEKTNDSNESIELKPSEEVDIVLLEPEEEIVIEIEREELLDDSNDIAIETIEETPSEPEQSGGLFGIFGNIFSSDDEKENESDQTESNQELALAEPELDDTSIENDTSIIDKAVLADVTDVKSNFDKLQPLATQGDANAQYQLGVLYYSGDDVKQDYVQAALWYRRAAQQGDVDAQYSLGNMYLMGEGIGQDDQQASYWYSLAADQGHTSAEHNLSNLQKTQISKPQLQVETTRTANVQLANSDNQVTAETAVNSDTTGKAEYEQGLAYAYGDGVRQNDRSAFNLFYEGAEKGYAPAQYKVAVAFAFGEGVRQDHNKAAEWYRSAAEQGYTIAQRNLATLYLDGKGVQQDKVQALAWYQIVASGGNAMDIRRRDMLENQLSEVELSQSQELAKQISSRLNNNPSL